MNDIRIQLKNGRVCRFNKNGFMWFLKNTTKHYTKSERDEIIKQAQEQKCSLVN